MPSLSKIGDLSCITSCLVLPGFLMDTLLNYSCHFFIQSGVRPKQIGIHSHVFFPRFLSATCNYFAFWLVQWMVCVLCDWLEWLLSFWFYVTQLKTALMMTKTNRDLLTSVFPHSSAPVTCYYALSVQPSNVRWPWSHSVFSLSCNHYVCCNWSQVIKL